MIRYLIVFLFLLINYSAYSQRGGTPKQKDYNPEKKISQTALQADYLLLRGILESKHPSLYWHTPKDSIDYYFQKYYTEIKGEMTEQQFAWKIIAPMLKQIRCGHTSFSMSDGYKEWSKSIPVAVFPLKLKVWKDSAFILACLDSTKSKIDRGSRIQSINGIEVKKIIDSLLQFMTNDGKSESINYVRLSNNFSYYYNNVFGQSEKFIIEYINSSGRLQQTNLKPVVFQSNRSAESNSGNKPRVNSLTIDKAFNMAILTINTFSGKSLKKFYKETFRQIKTEGISHLILDLRNNSGGKPANLLLQYLTRTPIKMADSVYVISKNLKPYKEYINRNFIDGLAIKLLTKKGKDGNYHLNRYESKKNNPIKENHYTGNLYVLTGGATFSSSTVLCTALKGQSDVTLIGEETGGGWYGHSSLIIPDIKLPNSELKVRLPLFRIVQNSKLPNNGSGVLPDYFTEPDYLSILNNTDKAISTAIELIKKKQL